MVQSGHIQMCVFWILLLQFAAAVSSRTSSYFTVRVGDDVTLPCENVIKPQPSCGSTTWLYSTRKRSETEELVTLGKICESPKSDRLSLTADCSLLIERVTDEDAGLYTCRQFTSGRQQGSDHVVHLSVIDITERTHTDKVTLTCSVLTFGDCRHTVEWLIQSTRNTKISPSTCQSSVSFDSDRKDESFTCKVTDNNNNNVLLCSSKPLTSCKRQPGVDKPSTTSTTTHTSTQTSENNKSTDVTLSPGSQYALLNDYWWVFLIGAVVVFVALLIIGVKVRSKKTEENQTEENNTVDAEVAYASVSYTKNTSSEPRDRSTGDGDAVTYTTVRAASTDPSDPVYSTLK
ncbi:uncharacterized protein LOC114428935 [Parambassis ranga]|uniref:Uncharacterized protein LOC114428935 n=1 Tax=Parambassis ranga TaxID=210632 RepID=A0A6P7HSL1_9TELE|nr:uncharacterized protein LOC114428935 [Parambassis ranga]